VLAESGRWPLALRWAKRLTKFFNKLAAAPEQSLLGRALRTSMQLSQDLHGVKKGHWPWMPQFQSAFQLWGVEVTLGWGVGRAVDSLKLRALFPASMLRPPATITPVCAATPTFTTDAV